MHHFFILSSTDGRLGCFCILAIVNNAAVNIWIHMSFWFSVVGFFRHVARSCPGQEDKWVRARSHTPKGCRFNSWSGHIPRLKVRSPDTVSMGGNQMMLLSHITVSFSLSLSLSQIKKHILRWGLKKNKTQKWNCWVLLHLLLYSLYFKVYFVSCKYCYSSFLSVSIFMTYLFQSVCVFWSEVSLL